MILRRGGLIPDADGGMSGVTPLAFRLGDEQDFSRIVTQPFIDPVFERAFDDRRAGSAAVGEDSDLTLHMGPPFSRGSSGNALQALFIIIELRGCVLSFSCCV